MYVISRKFGRFIFTDLVSKDSDFLSKLEMEYEVQKQITKAKQKLANDESLSKHVRKKHKEDYQKDLTKVTLFLHNHSQVRAQVPIRHLFSDQLTPSFSGT